MDMIVEDSSSSDDDYFNFIEPQANRERRDHVPRIINFIEAVVQNCNNKEFQGHFRLTRIQFEELSNRLTPLLNRQEGSAGRLRIQANIQLLSVLWLLATPDSFR